MKNLLFWTLSALLSGLFFSACNVKESSGGGDAAGGNAESMTEREVFEQARMKADGFYKAMTARDYDGALKFVYPPGIEQVGRANWIEQLSRREKVGTMTKVEFQSEARKDSKFLLFYIVTLSDGSQLYERLTFQATRSDGVVISGYASQEDPIEDAGNDELKNAAKRLVQRFYNLYKDQDFKTIINQLTAPDQGLSAQEWEQKLRAKYEAFGFSMVAKDQSSGIQKTDAGEVFRISYRVDFDKREGVTVRFDLKGQANDMKLVGLTW